MQIAKLEKICQLGPELMQKQIVQGDRFFYQNFDIKYLNSSKAYFSNKPEVDNVYIENYLCFQQGDMLKKVTEIAYKDKRVLIEDIFQVKEREGTEQSSEKVLEKRKDKITLFPTEKGKKSQSILKIGKKDKKNVVKNIVKLFITWIQRKKQQKTSPYKETKSQLKKLMAIQNYNNKLICQMFENHFISKVFYEFLASDADQRIGNSKISDKETHHQAIQHYLDFFSQASDRQRSQKNANEGVSSEGKRSSDKNVGQPSSTNEIYRKSS